MKSVKDVTRIFFVIFACVLFLLSTVSVAETIIWVAGIKQDSLGVDWDQPFVDLLTANGYTVQRENDTMKGSPLTTEQFDILESGDLIIISRSTGSGDYNSPNDWNSLSKPLICTTTYVTRVSRWQWLNSDALIGDGNSGCPPFHAEIPDHAIFAGVNLDENGNVSALDAAIGSGNASLANWTEYGDGELIATVADVGAVAIVYWPQDAAFHGDTDQFAGAPRLLFSCGARESTLSPVVATHGQGMYNLTEEGAKMFLNAVAFMLGKDTRVSDDGAIIPAGYQLAQNYPNPFNPTTTIHFSVPSSSTVKLSVLNVLGEEIAVLENQFVAAGEYDRTWSGFDQSGSPVNSGIYLYKLECDAVTLVKKMVLVK